MKILAFFTFYRQIWIIHELVIRSNYLESTSILNQNMEGSGNVYEASTRNITSLPRPNLETADIAVIVVYFALILAVGIWVC